MGYAVWLPFPFLLLVAVRLPGTTSFTPSLDSDFTFTLPAGQKECFYQPMPQKASLEIEYQVSGERELPLSWSPAAPCRAGWGTFRPPGK